MTDTEYTALIDQITDEHGAGPTGRCITCDTPMPCAPIRCADALHDARAALAVNEAEILDSIAENAAEVTARVDAIIAADDSERQHQAEDQLLHDVVATYAPAGIRAEIDRLAAADFERWCA